MRLNRMGPISNRSVRLIKVLSVSGALLGGAVASAGPPSLQNDLFVMNGRRATGIYSLESPEHTYTLYVNASELRSPTNHESNTAAVSVAEGDWYSDHYASREIQCTVDLSVLNAWQTGAALQVVLDPASPDCITAGMRVASDGTVTPWVFEQPLAISGTWSDPLYFQTSTSLTHEINAETGETARYRCRSGGGQFVRAGGFEINSIAYSFADQSTDGDYHFEDCNVMRPPE